MDAAEDAGILPSIAVEVTRVANHTISDLYGTKRESAEAAAITLASSDGTKLNKRAKVKGAEDQAFYQVLVKVSLMTAVCGVLLR